MPSISIISASVRQGRNSHRVALHLQRALAGGGKATADIIDLATYDFPVFHERLKYQTDPSPAVLEFADRIQQADGVVIVTPEYNGGYPAALKNAIDLLYDQWRRKPVAICTVSDGSFGGTQVITSLQFTLWKMKAWTVTAQLPVPKAQDAFAEDGTPHDAASWAKRTDAFLDELLWCVEAGHRMKA